MLATSGQNMDQLDAIFSDGLRATQLLGDLRPGMLGRRDSVGADLLPVGDPGRRPSRDPHRPLRRRPLHDALGPEHYLVLS